MGKLLIVDDSRDIRQQLKWGLGQDFAVHLAGDAQEALAVFKRENPPVVVLDLGLPPHEETPEEGFRCLTQMLEQNPFVKVILLTGQNERETALKAMRLGACDFYTKPPVLSELKVIITRALYLAKLEEQGRSQSRYGDGTDTWGILGNCREMLGVFTTIRKVAPSNAPILITGESGTGKELVAGAIHEVSLRRKGPLIPINCGAIPESLLESELFGHEKGAFTGAHQMVQGKLQYAHKGTLFLDEIGELPINLQVKLLRFLQEGVIQRVGGREDICIDTRTTCATNVDIQKAIAEGRFREDLYYRIGVITIHLPPLRERGDDILLIAEHFLRAFAAEQKRKVSRFTPAAASFLRGYEWPGNVRELRNRVQRAVIMSDGSAIEPADLGCDGESLVELEQPKTQLSLREARDRVEREMVLAAIKRQSGNMMKAAEDLGVSRPTLYDLMKKLALHHPSHGH